MKAFCRFFAVSCLTLIACAEAQAQIAAWEIAGTSAVTSNPKPAGTLGDFIDSANLTLGAGITASSAADTFGGSGFNSTALASAITGDQYLSFTISPTTGYAVSFTSLSLLSGVSTATTSFHGEVLSSATGFDSGASLYSYSFSSTSAPLQSITLSGVSALQNVTGPVEFRIYGWRDTGGTSTFRLRSLTGSDLVLNGTVSAVPEPSTYAAILGALTLAGVAMHRRRRSIRR